MAADQHQFVKCDTQVSTRLKSWSWFQFGMLLLMLFQLLIQIVEIGTPAAFLYGTFLYLIVYAYTTLMDRVILTEIGWNKIEQSITASGYN